MNRFPRGLAAAAALILLGPVAATQAGDHFHPRPFDANEHPFLRPRPHVPQTHENAGYPLCESHLAIPSFTNHYRGGYVGGGAAHGGHGRTAQEGTFGWDYVGLRPRGTRIFNGWSHGHKYQGGFGSYATEGPRPIEAFREKHAEGKGGEGH